MQIQVIQEMIQLFNFSLQALEEAQEEQVLAYLLVTIFLNHFILV